MCAVRTSPSKAANLPHRNKCHNSPHNTVVLKTSGDDSEVNKMFRQFIVRIDMYLRAQATERALQALSDDALADIGLVRADIAKLGVPAAPVGVKKAAAFPPFAETLFPASALRPA
jgi:uncharacterized protein YjiS (DUF1127 family)